MLCENAGGYNEFMTSLKLKNGQATPAEVCRDLLTDKDDEAASAAKPVVKQAQPVHRPAVHREARPAVMRDAVSMLQVSDVPKQRKLGVRGDMTVQGTVITSMLTSPIGDVKVSGEVNVMNSVEANNVQAAFLKASAGTTIRDRIVSKRDQLIVKGRIDADAVTADSLQASFLEINGVRQWALHTLEDFDETGSDGWSQGEITHCGAHTLLAGHCVELPSNEVSKTFAQLPPHSQVRIVAKYMFIDSWDGETGFLKVDNKPVWLESYNHKDGDSTHGINICGNETPERRFGRTIDITVPHTASSVSLTFGATTDEHACDESFGVANVMIFVR